MMSLTEMVLQKIQALPPEKQREVLEYVERIGTAPSKTAPRLDPEDAGRPAIGARLRRL